MGPINPDDSPRRTAVLLAATVAGNRRGHVIIDRFCRPHSETILLDGQPGLAAGRGDYRGCFCGVYHRVVIRLPAGAGNPPIPRWSKVKRAPENDAQAGPDDGRILNLKRCRRAKKRIALLLALAEERDIILLDSGPPIRTAFPPGILSGHCAVNAGNGQNHFSPSAMMITIYCHAVSLCLKCATDGVNGHHTARRAARLA